MTLLGVFLIVFIGGPLVFLGLVRGEPSRRSLRRLVLLAFLCAVAGVGIRYGVAQYWGENLLASIGGIACIWLGWIAVLAFVAQVLRHAYPGATTQRWSNVLGIVGTTLPWFGLIWASALAA
tara:strand:+ start:66 stop:431 length:366 start_codon:yes stop_codon:yes gene_type:complete